MSLNNNQSGCLYVARGSRCVAFQKEAPLHIPVENLPLCSSYHRPLAIMTLVPRSGAPGEAPGFRTHHLPRLLT